MKAKMERGAGAAEYDAGIGAMDRNLPQALAVSLALACLLAGCGGAVMPSQTTVPGDRSSIRSALPNAEYVMQGIADGKVQLHEGEYEEAAAPGSATKTVIRLGAPQAFGDINGDGTQDAAVTLEVDFGGSGTFTYLAPVLNQAGAAKALPAVLLGDRIIVNSLAIRDGNLVVDMLTRRPDQPMSRKPTLQVTRTFALRGDRLVQAN
ncbi:MAG: hypothetical protein ACK2T0_11305 [Anaerolineales bacterium]